MGTMEISSYLEYVAEKLGAHVVFIVSLKDRFDPDAYDIAFFGGQRLQADHCI